MVMTLGKSHRKKHRTVVIKSPDKSCFHTSVVMVEDVEAEAASIGENGNAKT